MVYNLQLFLSSKQHTIPLFQSGKIVRLFIQSLNDVNFINCSKFYNRYESKQFNLKLCTALFRCDHEMSRCELDLFASLFIGVHDLVNYQTIVIWFVFFVSTFTTLRWTKYDWDVHSLSVHQRQSVYLTNIVCNQWPKRRWSKDHKKPVQ